ncbi:MAG: VWA domain-containing protein, partial [Salinivirgaceae bacterium]|nr:VWA domain-containing protein [Salinivirgaceae bacterium]
VNKLAFSVYSAAALTHILRRQRDAVGLTLFSDHLEVMTDMKLSESHSKRIFTELNQCLHRTKSDFNKGTHLAETLHLIAEKIHKRSLVVLFTDMFTLNNEQLFPALEHLRYNKHEVILFHVTDKKLEQELAYPNRPLKFVDMETGQVMKLNPNDLRKDYAKSYQAFLTGLKLKCGQNNIDLAEADVNEDFQNVLVPFLVKRESLY